MMIWLRSSWECTDSITSLADDTSLDGLVDDLNQPLPPTEAPTNDNLNTLMDWLGEDQVGY
jgi:hypothetical protein